MSLGLIDLAQKLETDIRRKGLAPGARYLTAEESALLLGTSVATANRALRILAEQEVVIRRRNSGTFVGPAMIQGASSSEIRTVNIFMPTNMRFGAAVKFDLIIESVLAHMQDVSDIRVSYLPAEEPLNFVRKLIEPIRPNERLTGVIAISCPRDVYRYLGESDFPFVVLGSLYADQPYPSIDTDEYGAGELLTKHLLAEGHRRLALFSTSECAPGDNYFHDGINAALTTAKLPPNAMVLRVPGPDLAVLREQVAELLRMPKPPTGFILKMPEWAEEIASVVKQHGLRIPDDVQIAFRGFAITEQLKSRFPHVQPSAAYPSLAQLAGKMLAQLRSSQPLKETKVVIPYELCN